MLPKLKNPRKFDPVVARSTSWVRAPDSGILSAAVDLGDRVHKGERIGSISDPLGAVEEHIESPLDGIVIGRSNLPLAHEGDALFHLAAFKSVPRAESLVETFAAAHEDNIEPA